jgi:LmbE family N-acetylglucosaminyl deacetylase
VTQAKDTPLHLSVEGAELFVPDGSDAVAAVRRTTHLGIGAHQDDLEIMAYHGILECFQREDRWFSGVIVTDGGGSARDGEYAGYSDAQMVRLRKLEQKKAAYVGEYSALLLLDHPSLSVKDVHAVPVAEDLDALFSVARPEVVYTHNLADKHDTHVAVALRVIDALRRLPLAQRPRKVIGCEVWRDLDWLCDAEKVVMAVDEHDNLAGALMGVFDSQVYGGKRYDLAARGRRLANATFFESHKVDAHRALIWGMDLTPLVAADTSDPLAFVKEHIDRFADEVAARMARLKAR